MAELSPTVTADADRTDLSDRYHHLRLHDHPQTGGSVQLSPYDLANLGRAIPMVFFYEATLDPHCLLYTSPSPRDATLSRMPSSA